MNFAQQIFSLSFIQQTTSQIIHMELWMVNKLHVHVTYAVNVSVNPMGTVDVYSSSLGDDTGPVDMYSRIPARTQVTCIAT